jgi:hypothetical protein
VVDEAGAAVGEVGLEEISAALRAQAQAAPAMASRA